MNETEENGGDGNVSIGFRTFTETSEVTFKELTEEDINAYVATGETIDKAGAYGIQGHGALLIEDAAEAEQMVTALMGDRVEARKEFLAQNANFNKVDTFMDKVNI